MRVQNFAAACFALFTTSTAGPIPPSNVVDIDPSTKTDFSGMLRHITVYFPPYVPDKIVADAAWFIQLYPHCLVTGYKGFQPSNGIDDKAFVAKMNGYAQYALRENLGPAIPIAFVENGKLTEGSYCPQKFTCGETANGASE